MRIVITTNDAMKMKTSNDATRMIRARGALNYIPDDALAEAAWDLANEIKVEIVLRRFDESQPGADWKFNLTTDILVIIGDEIYDSLNDGISRLMREEFDATPREPSAIHDLIRSWMDREFVFWEYPEEAETDEAWLDTWQPQSREYAESEIRRGYA